MIRFQRHDAASAKPLLDALADLYEQAWARARDPFRSRTAFLSRYADHANAPGFALVTAHEQDSLIGYIYGRPIPAESRRWKSLLEPLPADYTREDGRRTVGVNELHVRADRRRQGVASALHAEYVRLWPHAERVTLLVDPANTAASAVYRSWGYVKVGQSKPFPDSPVFDVLVRQLPLD